MHESSLIACDFSVSVDCATFRFWLRSGGLVVGAVAVVRRAVVVGSGGFAQTQVARSSERPPTCEFLGARESGDGQEPHFVYLWEVGHFFGSEAKLLFSVANGCESEGDFCCP
jgi:hypothetical protein